MTNSGSLFNFAAFFFKDFVIILNNFIIYVEFTRESSVTLLLGHERKFAGGGLPIENQKKKNWGKKGKGKKKTIYGFLGKANFMLWM